MSTTEKMWALVQRLKARSEVDDVPWEETNREDVFQVILPRYTVRMWEDENDIYIGIYDDAGRLMEVASDRDFESMHAYERMKELLTAARRRALGVEEALDDILEILDEDQPE